MDQVFAKKLANAGWEKPKLRRRITPFITRRNGRVDEFVICR